MEEISELCRKAKSSNGEAANKFYQEAYAKLELLHIDNTSVTQEDLLNNWGMALASHYGQTQDDTEAGRLFAQANKKFELALEASLQNKHLVLTHWGDLYLQKGRNEKKAGKKKEAAESYTEARAKYDKALGLNANCIEALESSSSALSEQGEINTGNDQLWFFSQAAEKNRQIADFKAGKPIATSGLSAEDKLLKANENKELGNNSFKAGDLTGAMRHWYNALNCVNGAYGFSAEQEKKVRDIKVALHNNMANIHIKKQKYDRAIAGLNQVLVIDANNVKGLFRRGRAYLALNDIEKARADLEKAKSLSPQDSEIKNALIELDKKEKEQNAKQKSFYSKMF